MRILSGYRPLWLLLTALFIFVITLLGRAWGQTPTQASPEAQPGRPASWSIADSITNYQDRLRLDPEDTAAYAGLGLALLQRVRETADASLYLQAEKALNEAIKRDPKQFEALIGQGLLALARHDFTAALAWGEQAKAINPQRVQVYGIIGDAQIELGDYEVAVKTIQKMIDTRPELSSYSRLSYIRELHGDRDGAIEAMSRAVGAGGKSEGGLWTKVQLGHLYFNRGDLENAEKEYMQTLYLNPDYSYAFAGVARVQAAKGEYDTAIKYYEKIVEILPLPEFVIALGELYEVTGQEAAAQRQYALVEAIEQLNVSSGMNVDLEMALFKANRGLEPAQTVAQARLAYKQRPSIYGADALAWALYQNGEYAEAQRYSQESLRLGTRDALLHYHAGMIAYALSETAQAREHLEESLAINPYFSVIYAPQAQALLAEKLDAGS